MVDLATLNRVRKSNLAACFTIGTLIQKAIEANMIRVMSVSSLAKILPAAVQES